MPDTPGDSPAIDGLTITHAETAYGGEYVAHLPGTKATGVLQYRRNGAMVSADHTLVPGALGGRGIAARLVEALIADARTKDWKIVPACSYVAAAFTRHPEWADLRA